MCYRYLVLLSFALLAGFVCAGGADEVAAENNGTTTPANSVTVDQPADTLNRTNSTDLDLPDSSNNITKENQNATDESNSMKDTNTTIPPAATAANENTTSSIGENTTATPESVTEHDSTTETEETTSTPEGMATTTQPTDHTSNTTSNDTLPVEPTEPTSNITVTEQPTTAGSTRKPSDYSVRLSETNLLMFDAGQADSLFIELKGQAGEDLTGLWLVVHDALPGATTPHVMLNLDSVVLNTEGFYLLNNDTGLTLTQELAATQALLIGLYVGEPQASVDTSGLLDTLLYSSGGSIDKSLQEEFVDFTKFPLTLDYSQLAGLNGQKVSLSRCSDDVSNGAFVLAVVTAGHENQCSLSSNKKMEMLLTLKKPPCPDKLPTTFNEALVTKIISGMNSVGHCGISRKNIDGVQVIKSCIGKQMTRVDIHFQLRANLDSHLALVDEGYKSFVTGSRVIQLVDNDFLLDNCTQLCRPPLVNPHNDNNSSDNKTQLTVGVVLTCVGVFIVVLLAVVFYMKRKRRGILQFRMTRLDEDDDDIMGDMDDFVGNQGPTFRNFR